MSETEAAGPGPVRRFLRFIWGALKSYFIMVGLLVTLGPLLLVIAMARMQATDGGADGKKPAFAGTAAKPVPLTLELEGVIAQRDPGFTERLIAKLFGGPPATYLQELRSALRRAGVDPRVKSLDVTLQHVEASPAEWADVRRLLAEFRATGKPVTVAMVEPQDWSYYAASAASRLVLRPVSSVSIPGPTFTLVYLGTALRKLGVDIEVIRAGKFKSAFEPLVLDSPSPEALEEYQTMQASLLDHMVAAVAEGRGKPVEQVRSWFKQSLFTGQTAVEQGLVDAIAHEGDSADAPAATGPESAEPPASGPEAAPTPPAADSSKPVKVSDYFRATRDDHIAGIESGTEDGGIALIEAVGEIRMSNGDGGMGDEEVITPRRMRRELQWAREDSDVKAVVLRVSSPGGSAVASELIWNEVNRLSELKPVVVSMGAYAASGGYYISAPARHIVAEPSTITGSIGVIGMLPKVPQFKEKYGVSFHVVTQSDRATLLNPGEATSDTDKEAIQKVIQDTYTMFVRRVAEGRNLEVAAVDALAQGRVYSGSQAKELSLVDELGGLQAAFDKAKELAGLDPKKLYPLYRFDEDEMDLRECLKGPVKMMECLSELDARTLRERLAPATGGLWHAGEALTGAAADRLLTWLRPGREERALMLWPAYLGFSWR